MTTTRTFQSEEKTFFKRYWNKDGCVLLVDSNPEGDVFMTFSRNGKLGKQRRFKSTALPERTSMVTAQRDLNAYASDKKLQEVE